jgi:bifunctional UDP-N-acetylglucosamine pyrophosphorylase / glucosamine-1-phosphate N-acetyltransferase
MPRLTAVVLAAGQGTRMRSDTPKVLHDLCGRPLVRWPVEAARQAGAERIVVVGGPDRAIAPHLPDGVDLAVQEQARGTGDAVRAAASFLEDGDTVVILSGDVPLVTAEAIADLAAAHAEAGCPATMATMVLDDPGAYGRVVRDAEGNVAKVVEAKAPGDATPEELAVTEVNTGIFAFDAGPLRGALDRLTADNAQGEYYLPEVLTILRGDGASVAARVVDDPSLTLGVNDRNDLATVRRHAQQRIQERHGANGVTIVQPESTMIDVTVEIGRETVVEPSTVLRGTTRIGERCRVGPCTTISDTRLGDGVTALHAYLVDSAAEDSVTIGPFVHLRGGTVLRAGAKAGTFVEMKNADVGEGAKVPHLSYLGDAGVGPGSNVAAANVTANYDGRHKHRTNIGANVRTGVDTTFVAPVTVGDGAVIAAGSVITEDVPPDALGVARARQRNVEGYARRKH